VVAADSTVAPEGDLNKPALKRPAALAADIVALVEDRNRAALKLLAAPVVDSIVALAADIVALVEDRNRAALKLLAALAMNNIVPRVEDSNNPAL
jgi:hypothetical protein